MATILTTTGISLYTNTRREHKTNTPTDDEMRQYLRMKPEHASSEANSLLQIVKPGDHLVFLYTKTPEAKRCADLLQEFFQSDGYKHVRLVPLEFQGDAQHIETIGLRNLVNTLIHEVEKAQKNQQEVVINATAGLKAQVVYSTMIGMLYHVPVKYIYEEFQRIVTFNPIALVWDTNLYLYHEKFFRWLDTEPRNQQDVESYLKNLPDRESIEALLTPPDIDGEVFLSPMGEVLRHTFERETEEAELVSWPVEVQVKNIKDKIAHSIVRQGHDYPKWTLETSMKLAAIPYVQTIIPKYFNPVPRSRIAHMYENGVVELDWTEGGKTARLTVTTTALGRPQTRKVADEIRKRLEIE